MNECKCPLFAMNERRAQYGEETDIGDCIQDRCAWWDVHREECAILGIAYRLAAIAEAVNPPEVENEPEP